MNLLYVDFIISLSQNICFVENIFLKHDKTIYKYFKDKYRRRINSQVQIKKKIETRNYLLDEINHNDIMSERYRKICKYLNYVERLLILVSTVTGCG